MGVQETSYFDGTQAIERLSALLPHADSTAHVLADPFTLLSTAAAFGIEDESIAILASDTGSAWEWESENQTKPIDFERSK